MSWNLFKVNMLLYMNNPIAINSYAQFAVKFATEYDSCMRRGGQLIGKESVLAGNLPLMISLLNVGHAKALTKTQPGKHAFLADVGEAIKGYWTGATLQPFPIYPIPAPGSIQNLILNSGMVTNPGTWPKVPFEIPTLSSLVFLEALVLFAKIHLFTLQGMFMTTSLYPSAPSPIPAPGVANWVGYTIPNIPMFGISLNQSTDLDSPDVDKNNVDGPLTDKPIKIKNRPESVFTTDAERKNADLGLTTTDETINEELRDSLGSSTTLDDKVNKILEAERKKHATGLDRFYSKAIQSIGDFKNLLPDTNEQFQQSLAELQQELQQEKDNCCIDCD